MKDYYYPHGVDGGLSKAKQKILQIGNLAKKNNHSILLVSYPWPAQLAFKKEEIDWSLYLKDICKEIGRNCIALADITKEMQLISKYDKKIYSKFFIEGDVHLSKKGNKIMAKFIQPYITKYFSNN